LQFASKEVKHILQHALLYLKPNGAAEASPRKLGLQRF
jgi:hypothetical protein